MNESTCMGCARPLIQQRAWLDANSTQMAAWILADCRMIKGYGRCNACYQRAYRRRELPTQKTRQSIPRQPCHRCGVRSAEVLCVDCRDVVADLDEVARWVA